MSISKVWWMVGEGTILPLYGTLVQLSEPREENDHETKISLSSSLLTFIDSHRFRVPGI